MPKPNMVPVHIRLRKDVTSVLMLPVDLTVAEVERIRDVLSTWILPVPEFVMPDLTPAMEIALQKMGATCDRPKGTSDHTFDALVGLGLLERSTVTVSGRGSIAKPVYLLTPAGYSARDELAKRTGP